MHMDQSVTMTARVTVRLSALVLFLMLSSCGGSATLDLHASPASPTVGDSPGPGMSVTAVGNPEASPVVRTPVPGAPIPAASVPGSPSVLGSPAVPRVSVPGSPQILAIPTPEPGGDLLPPRPNEPAPQPSPNPVVSTPPTPTVTPPPFQAPVPVPTQTPTPSPTPPPFRAPVPMPSPTPAPRSG